MCKPTTRIRPKQQDAVRYISAAEVDFLSHPGTSYQLSSPLPFALGTKREDCASTSALSKPGKCTSLECLDPVSPFSLSLIDEDESIDSLSICSSSSDASQTCSNLDHYCRQLGRPLTLYEVQHVVSNLLMDLCSLYFSRGIVYGLWLHPAHILVSESMRISDSTRKPTAFGAHFHMPPPAFNSFHCSPNQVHSCTALDLLDKASPKLDATTLTHDIAAVLDLAFQVSSYCLNFLSDSSVLAVAANFKSTVLEALEDCFAVQALDLETVYEDACLALHQIQSYLAPRPRTTGRPPFSSLSKILALMPKSGLDPSVPCLAGL